MGYKKSIVGLSCSVNNFVVIFDRFIVAISLTQSIANRRLYLVETQEIASKH